MLKNICLAIAICVLLNWKLKPISDPKIVEFLRRRKKESQEKREAEKRDKLTKISGLTSAVSVAGGSQSVETMDHTSSDCCHKDVSFVFKTCNSSSQLLCLSRSFVK